MVPGFNHNIKHNGQIFHVQTEDTGTTSANIITHLFLGGNILATRKSSYSDILSNENLDLVVRELMKEQHKAIVKELVAGTFDARVSAQGEPEDPPSTAQPPVDAQSASKPLSFDERTDADRSLDEIILDYLSKEK